MKPIVDVAKNRLGIDPKFIEPYGHYKAKISLDFLDSLPVQTESRVILVTAINPTPAGEGKTTTTVGLGDALNLIGKNAIICLREPSLGPVFGMKGGAAGGGRAQVVPMEDINLHFTGDFSAIQLAHNLLSALIDNHLHHGNALQLDPRKISWRRVLDMNDRALREIVISLGGVINGLTRQDGFDIVVASEVMAILCLAESMQDLKNRLSQIVVGYDSAGKAITAEHLKATGAMATLLKDALKPNLVQTLENNPALIHGGPFANIAHGCNSVLSTKAGLRLADYVVTEAGFGADLGAEKFLNIKCRKSGIKPSVTVVVATVRALKFHGGVRGADLTIENLDALRDGFVNLERHVINLREKFNVKTVVAVNQFSSDTKKETKLLIDMCDAIAVKVAVCNHWQIGGSGATDLAKMIVDETEQIATEINFTYDVNCSIIEKIEKIAKKIYLASEIKISKKAKTRISELQLEGYGKLPVCIAKTQYSFSSNPELLGAPKNHLFEVREVRLSAGAGFIVVVCGNIMTMPGLPREPAANSIGISNESVVSGLY